MDNTRPRTLKSLILKNSFITCIIVLILIAIVINTALPHYFYITQNDMNKDISECINDNISMVLSDTNYIYTELSNNENLLYNIDLCKNSWAENSYLELRKSDNNISREFLNTTFCYKNLLSGLLIFKDGRSLALDSSRYSIKEIEAYMNGRKIDKPSIISIPHEDKANERLYVILRPFYNNNGSYICDIAFILSKEKSDMLSKQANFALLESGGKLMISNYEELYDSKDFLKFTNKTAEISDFSGMQAINGKKYFITSSVVSNYNWRLYVLLSADGFYSCIRRISCINIIIFLAALILMGIYMDSFSTVIGGEIRDVVYELDSFLNKKKFIRQNIYENRIARILKNFLTGKSVYYKFLFYNITCLAVPSVIVALTANIYYIRSIGDEFQRTADTLADMNKMKVESIFDKYNNAMNVILVYDNIKDNINTYEMLDKSTIYSEEAEKCYERLSNEIERIYLYSGDFRFLYQNNHEDLIIKWPKHENVEYDTTAFANEFQATLDRVRNKYIYSITKKISLSTKNYAGSAGYCTIQFDSDELAKNLYASSCDAYFYITDKSGITTATIDGKNTGKTPNEKKDYLYVSRDIDNYNSQIIMECSMENIYYVYTIIIMIFVIILGFLGIFLMINSSRMARYIIEPISEAEKSMEGYKVKYIITKKKYSDEFYELIDNVNSMKLRIEKLIGHIYNQEIVSKDLQMEALRAQITPHFLYNIFEIINAMVDLGDKRVSKLVILVSDFFRQGISRSENIILLGDEIKYLDVYLNIQSFILNDNIEIIRNIDKACLDSKVIRFVIQPVFENIFKHAMYKKTERIKIHMNIYSVGKGENKKVKIVVRDNGVGMDKASTDRLLRYINGEENGFKGVGLKNINERLVLHYGENYKMKIYSCENKGTAVVIRIPYRQ